MQRDDANMSRRYASGEKPQVGDVVEIPPRERGPMTRFLDPDGRYVVDDIRGEFVVVARSKFYPSRFKLVRRATIPDATGTLTPAPHFPRTFEISYSDPSRPPDRITFHTPDGVVTCADGWEWELSEVIGHDSWREVTGEAAGAPSKRDTTGEPDLTAELASLRAQLAAAEKRAEDAAVELEKVRRERDEAKIEAEREKKRRIEAGEKNVAMSHRLGMETHFKIQACKEVERLTQQNMRLIVDLKKVLKRTIELEKMLGNKVNP